MKYFSLDDLIESNLKSIAEPSNIAAPEVASETDSLKQLSEAMNQAASSEDEEAAIREALKSLNKGEFDGLLDDINDEDIAELMNQAQWILRVLRAYGIDPAVVDTLEVLMRECATVLSEAGGSQIRYQSTVVFSKATPSPRCSSSQP